MVSFEEDRDPAPLVVEEQNDADLFTQTEGHAEVDEADLSTPGSAPHLTLPPHPRSKPRWMREANFSAHRIELAGACPLRFYLRYGPDKRADPTGYQAGVGKIVHGVYHDAGFLRLQGKIKGLPLIASVDELLWILSHQEAQLARETKGKDKDYFEVTGSMLKESEEIIRSEGPLDCRHVWAVEHPMTLRLGPTGRLVVGGYIDWIDVVGNPARLVTITDWKTGQNQLPDQEELYHSSQAGMYMIWAKQQFPTAQVRFRLRNVRKNEERWLFWSKVHQEIHINKALSRKAMADWIVQSKGNVPANPGPAGENCRYCPYREGDSRFKPCAAYLKTLDETRMRAQKDQGIDQLSMYELMNEYRLARGGENLNKDRKKRIGEAILAKIPEGHKSFREGDLLAVKVKAKKIRMHDRPADFITDLAKAAGVEQNELANDLTDLKLGKLDSFVKDLDEDEQRTAVAKVIDQHERVTFGKESLQVRETKEMF